MPETDLPRCLWRALVVWWTRRINAATREWPIWRAAAAPLAPSWTPLALAAPLTKRSMQWAHVAAALCCWTFKAWAAPQALLMRKGPAAR